MSCDMEIAEAARQRKMREVLERDVLRMQEKQHKTRIVIAALFIINAAIWAYAGYAIGNVSGRGWRGAMIDHGCNVVCKL